MSREDSVQPGAHPFSWSQPGNGRPPWTPAEKEELAKQERAKLQDEACDELARALCGLED